MSHLLNHRQLLTIALSVALATAATGLGAILTEGVALPHYAAADHPSLIARMAERRQQRDPESAGVVLSAQQVHAPEAAVERLAVPPPDFGLHQPVRRAKNQG